MEDFWKEWVHQFWHPDGIHADTPGVGMVIGFGLLLLTSVSLPAYPLVVLFDVVRQAQRRKKERRLGRKL
jgi:hypothetical protein